MIQDRYLLITYYDGQPKDDAHTRRKYIEKANFDTLCNDYFSDVELDDVRYIITSRYEFKMNSPLTGIVHFLIIDVKRNGTENTIHTGPAAGR